MAKAQKPAKTILYTSVVAVFFFKQKTAYEIGQ